MYIYKIDLSDLIYRLVPKKKEKAGGDGSVDGRKEAAGSAPLYEEIDPRFVSVSISWDALFLL